MSLFKAYDIRGTVPDQLNEEVIARIARAFAVYLNEFAIGEKEKISVIIGQDNRQTSSVFARSATNALLKAGIDVVDIGLASTPYFYYAACAQSCDGGMMITASHNPPQYNGCKLVSAGGQPIGADSGLPHIQSLFEKDAKQTAKKTGVVSALDILNRYTNESISLGGGAKEIKPLTVAVDTGNGVSALMAQKLFEKLPIRLIPLFFDLDGTFPNHMPNPLEEKNTSALRKAVKEKNADLGIAMDADGDRIIFIDEHGNSVPSDLMTALLARDMLAQFPQKKILYDLRSSKVVKETILAHGGMPEATRVGHTFVKNQMRRQDAIFAGELSGHFYYKFQNYGYFEASLATIVQVLRILSREKKPLSEILKPLKKYWSTGEINFEVSDKIGAIKKLENRFGTAQKIDKLDGLTVEYQDWWCNVRPSNTENFLRMVLEAKTPALKEQKFQELRNLIMNSKS